MARSLNLRPRTVRRIEKAARTGEPHPVSPGVLVELAAMARGRAATLGTRTPGGRDQVRCFEMIALELDAAVRVWTATRRPRRGSR
jgi:hypothetical protein